jgi:hypothetical protein
MFNFLEKNNEQIVSGLYLESNVSSGSCSMCGVAKHRPLIMAMAEQEGKILFGFPYADKPIPKTNLIKVGAVPAGFLLIKREVFEKISKPWFVYGDPELDAKQARHGQPFGEDVYFSYKARNAGFNLWVDTRASLLHYAPDFVGLPEDLPFVHTGSKDSPREAAAVRKEYLAELEKHALPTHQDFQFCLPYHKVNRNAST